MNTINTQSFTAEYMNWLSDLRDIQQRTQECSLDIIQRNDIPAFDLNWNQVTFSESQRVISYPPQVLRVLFDLYREYTYAFQALLEEYGMKDAYPLWGINCFVQIDMIGLPQDFLDLVYWWNFSDIVLKEMLRRSIFEVENSLAAYSLLRKLGNPSESKFSEKMDILLWELRDTFSARVYLATLSDEKYQWVAMFDCWFKKWDWISDSLVRQNTWFDGIISPRELLNLWDINTNNSLFYTRASLDRKWLIDPREQVSSLWYKNFRKYLRNKSLTYNIDDPEQWAAKLNDTKEYMPDIWMWYIVEEITNVITDDYRSFLLRNKSDEVFSWTIFTDRFFAFLQSQWISQSIIDTWDIELQFKPLFWAYWGYWQVSWSILEGKVRTKLNKELKKRWKFIVQPRMPRSDCIDIDTWLEYIYIDRIFLSMNPSTRAMQFMWWFRNYMPKNSIDGQKWIVHWSSQTVYSIIK